MKFPHETKMTQKLTTIGHRTAFNNEQSPYRIVSYKRPRNDHVNNSNEKTNGLSSLTYDITKQEQRGPQKGGHRVD